MQEKTKLLVVDDDVTLLKSINNILSNAGYLVSIAKSGKQAVAAIEKGNIPDLILLDIAMPEMNGYDTFQAIKAISDIPIIFVTSLNEMKDELAGLKLGAIDYITKPFVTDILLARINNHLSNLKRIPNDTADDNDSINFDEQKLSDMEQLLTEAEFKVAKKIALGFTNQEIADELAYSYGYVKKIAYRIFDKLGINKRNEVRDYFIK